jgi:SAM-dependent methyltransferase
MGFYRSVVLPRLCDLAMRNRLFEPYRRRVIGEAQGRVLEIGAGSGLNLRLYPPGVNEVLALEPDPKLIAMAQRQAAKLSRRIRFLEASAEDIPLADESVDTVVTTWTMCSIPDVARALKEMRRVLRPGGRLLFVEHGLSPDKGVCAWQNRLTPAWRCIAGGCHLNRPIAELVKGAGFALDELETGYAPGPKIMTYLYEGAAHPG